MTYRILPLAALLSLALPASAQVAANSTDTAMYFHSHVQDAPTCKLTVDTGQQMQFDPSIFSPAATCPDAFGWMQFLQAVQQNFWTNWANDETVWVQTPKALCTADTDTDCCFVSPGATPQVGYRGTDGIPQPPKDVGGPGEYCPYIPADWGGADETTFAGGKPISSHNTTFLRSLDPARIARQREVEVVYRNDSFVRYTTANTLYSKAGLKDLFTRVSGQAKFSAPYRPAGQGVSYPPDAVMFKADWIPEETMYELGYLPSDVPYITMLIDASTDNGKTYEEGLYYLAAITGASKALPNWHWYAFEHVNNLGRCDYTGCNDSYGYSTTVTINAPLQPGDKPTETMQFASNFIAPHTEDDQLDDSTQLFVRGKTYPSGKISLGLEELFALTEIGSADEALDPTMPSPTDPAWRNYRLKGTQTQFYTNDGYETIVGASITEGGFVNTASCMSCHVQASVDADANPGTSVGGTGRLNLSGIGTSVNGAPYTGDFFMRGTTQQRAVRTDFVWGTLFAQ